MVVEVLCFDGCPNHEALLPRVRALMRAVGIKADVALLSVEDVEAAERERFLGEESTQ